MRRLIVVTVLLIVSFLGSTVAAQDSTIRVPTPTAEADCPDDLVCIEYEGVTIEVDPACGVVQGIIVGESLARTTELADGGVRTTEAYGLHGIVLVQRGTTYEVVSEFSEPAAGSLSGVRWQSVGCIEWSVPE